MNNFTLTLALAGLTTALESQFFNNVRGHQGTPSWSTKSSLAFDFAGQNQKNTYRPSNTQGLHEQHPAANHSHGGPSNIHGYRSAADPVHDFSHGIRRGPHQAHGSGYRPSTDHDFNSHSPSGANHAFSSGGDEFNAHVPAPAHGHAAPDAHD